MKWLIALGILAGAGFVGYRSYDSSAAPVRHYERFAEEILNRRYDVAEGMSDGLSRQRLEESGTMEKIGVGPTMFQTLFPSRFDIRSKEKVPDGGITLDAVQTVLWNPPGVESVMRPAMSAKMNQRVTLRKTGGGWKVTAFTNTFGSMDAWNAN
jgi:hypothetical protein